MSDIIRSKIQRMIEMDPARYGKVFEIFPADANTAIGFRVPTFIVDCYSDKIFQEVTRYKNEFMILVRNGRITSFLCEVFLLNHASATGTKFVSGIDLSEFALLAAKKFVGVGMNGISESEMAATIFLESAISGQDGWSAIYGLRDTNPELRAAYDHFSRVVSEFIFHHEVGHEFVLDARFRRLVDDYIDAYITSLTDLQNNQAKSLRTELFADLFAIHVIFVKYSKTFNESTMRNMCKIAFCSVTIVIMLNNIIHNLYKNNIDTDHVAPDLYAAFTMHWHRFNAITKYIGEFSFDPNTTILCNPDGFNYDIDFVKELFYAMLNGTKIVEPITDGTRGILQALAQIMIDNHGQISKFIEKTRRYRPIEKDLIAEHFIEDELRKTRLHDV